MRRSFDGKIEYRKTKRQVKNHCLFRADLMHIMYIARAQSGTSEKQIAAHKVKHVA